jgi:hypothetical protein
MWAASKPLIGMQPSAMNNEYARNAWKKLTNYMRTIPEIHNISDYKIITILDINHRPVFIGLSVPHRKHITSPLRAQQVNATYRFVTMVY